MYCLVSSLDHWRAHCTALERHLSYQPDGPRREALIRELFAARQAEQQSILDLRDGTAYLVGLVAPAAEQAP